MTVTVGWDEGNHTLTPVLGSSLASVFHSMDDLDNAYTDENDTEVVPKKERWRTSSTNTQRISRVI